MEKVAQFSNELPYNRAVCLFVDGIESFVESLIERRTGFPVDDIGVQVGGFDLGGIEASAHQEGKGQRGEKEECELVGDVRDCVWGVSGLR